MNRLRVRCFLASVGMHGLLLVLFLAGSGFVAHHQEPTWVDLPVLDFIPSRLVDEAIIGGGDPRGGAPSTAAAAPQPQPQPQPTETQPVPSAPPKSPTPTAKPERRETVKPVPPKPEAPDPEAYSEKGPRKTAPKPKIEVSKTLVTRNTQDDAAARRKAARQAEAEAEAEAALEAERAGQVRSSRLSGAVSRLRGTLSGSSVVAVPYGPGGGGETYAGYGLYVRRVYKDAWRPPVEVPDRPVVVTAKVVIARDGRVVSAEIAQRSNIPALDKSVENVLNRVTSIKRPFPEGSPDERKTFLIDFDLHAREGTG